MIYMYRTKILMLSLLAALALTAVASSTASAGTEHEFKVEGKTIAKGSKVELQGQIVELGQFESLIKGAGIHITCNNAFGNTENVLEAEGKAKFEAEFEACTVYTITKGLPESVPGCKIKVTKATATGELTEAGVIMYKGSGTSELFNEIEITESGGGGCHTGVGVGSPYLIKGTQVCAIPSFGFESDIGEVVCDAVGSSNLKMKPSQGSEKTENEAKLYARLAVTGTKGQTLGTNG
jgi:hypothetical protein